MRIIALTALALSGAFAVAGALAPAALASTPHTQTSIATQPSDDLIKDGFTSEAACLGAIPDIRRQSPAQATLICRPYTDASHSVMWGIYSSQEMSGEQQSTERQSSHQQTQMRGRQTGEEQMRGRQTREEQMRGQQAGEEQMSGQKSPSDSQ